MNWGRDETEEELSLRGWSINALVCTALAKGLSLGPAVDVEAYDLLAFLQEEFDMAGLFLAGACGFD